ncbi:MAG: response regulator [Nitrospinae bacterium]|jgi:DNA-binding NtrC family response regulator|nr:response regulator [Nitrospinota bacterium]MDA1110764.1 response regulator [Nitrospinota bacterium]
MISNIKILIVDDGTLSSLRVLTGLKNSGFNYIELAVNANCMFDYLDRGNFGLIISNWSRLEMNGMEFIKNIRKRSDHKDIPIIMLTNPYDFTNFAEPLKDEEVTFVPKPLDLKKIGETIREIFEKKGVSSKN